MMSDAYDSPPPRTAGSAMAGKSRLLESSGDEAYAKMQARLHSRSAQRPFGTPEPARHRSAAGSATSRRSQSSLEARPPRPAPRAPPPRAPRPAPRDE